MKELMTNISPVKWQTINIQIEKKTQKTLVALIQDQHKENHT